MSDILSANAIPWATGVPDEIAEPIDLGAQLDHTKRFVQRHVVVTEAQATMTALWTAHTHVFEAMDCTPYLAISSATKRAGKTRLLEVLETIVRSPWFTGRVSAAALTRKVNAERPTLLLDESDAALKATGGDDYSEVLRGLLNSGYRASGKVTICVVRGSNITAEDFSTFGPKAIAGIGKLPDTIADRSIPIVLRRRRTDEPVDRWRERDGRQQAKPIHDAFVAWAPSAMAALREARPALPEALDDRAADVLEPLIAIADLAGGDWPARARTAAVTLMGDRAAEDDAVGVQLLADVRIAFREAGDPEVLASKDIIAALAALEDRPWATWTKGDKPITPHALAKRLADFEVVPAGNLWLGGKVARGYRRSAFLDAWARYCADEALKRKDANESGPESAKHEALGPEPLADGETAGPPNKSGLPSALADAEADPGEEDADGDRRF